MFTQPLMYKKISTMENVLSIFEKDVLKRDSSITKQELDEIKNAINNKYELNYKEATEDKFDTKEFVGLQWKKYIENITEEEKYTGSVEEKLKRLGEKICTLPSEINFHPQLKKIYESRLDTIKTGKGIDWGTAEALAWATMIDSGMPVRISGQDVERGTFSHRHCVVYDQNEYKKYIPLLKLTNNSSHFQACNSHLSEFAVLGYELGYSYYNPNALTIWEAQFGDFGNGGQVIIDQVISYLNKLNLN